MEENVRHEIMNGKQFVISLIVAVVVGVFIGWAYFGGSSEPAGATQNNIDSSLNVRGSASYQVDGTDVIDSSGNVTISSHSAVIGTSTVSKSFDGFMATGTVSSVATGTKALTITNSGAADLCTGGGDSYLYFDSTAFSPSLKVSIGTSTSDTNLLATTTVATTTDTVIQLKSSSFVNANAGTINLYLGDITNTSASSTYYDNWTIKLGVQCATL